jgi:acetyl-CoA C-acetyltransferase
VREAVIVSAARTAIGNFGESLRDIPAVHLAAIAIKGAMKKAGLKPEAAAELRNYAPQPLKDIDQIELEKKHYDWGNDLKGINVDEVILGNVLQAGEGQNPGRLATIYAGLNKEVNAYTINKLCGSGLKAIASAAQSIMLEDADVVIAAGTENMSAVPYLLPKARWGYRMSMSNAEFLDSLIYDGLLEHFYNYHMGMTAENIAAKYGITRQEQDELSLNSNNRALAASKEGIFKQEIVPVEIKEKQGIKRFEIDEHPRQTSIEALAKLSPVFKKDGTITAGNSSGITDGAAAVVIMSKEKAQGMGLKPMAVIKAYAIGGVDPAYMGLGAIPAIKRALKKAGLTLQQISAIELNEAFAAQALGVVKELGLDLQKINPYGSGISLGHPIGCTGVRITVTLLHEMVRKNAQYGLAALCIGGGQGMALILERK